MAGMRDGPEPIDSPIARDTLAIVLAGGRGSRLAQLTDRRAKPAVSFAGKYRIIDFTLSNCVNSGVRRIGVATQYRAQSLIRHMARGWSFLDGRFGEFIELLPAEQGATDDWYQGTADAVWQNIDFVRHYQPAFVLVLAGDHVYKMDYARLIHDHIASGAPMTLACVEAPATESRALGVVGVDEKARITSFQEKPADPVTIPGRPDRILGSMGIYVIDTPFLLEQLERDAAIAASEHDFGKDIIPRVVADGVEVHAHSFGKSCVGVQHGGEPYWRDVGTVDAFWEASLDLTRVIPALNLYDPAWPIWTYQPQMPPAKFLFDDDARRGQAHDSLVSGGCIVSGSTVKRSLLSTNVHVHSFCTIEDTVVLPSVDIGRNCQVRRAIIDKECRLPEGFRVGFDLEEDRRRGFHVTEKGIVLVTPGMLESA